MKAYIVKIELDIDAENEKEALEKFWDIVNDTDYQIKPNVKEY